MAVSVSKVGIKSVSFFDRYLSKTDVFFLLFRWENRRWGHQLKHLSTAVTTNSTGYRSVYTDIILRIHYRVQK